VPVPEEWLTERIGGLARKHSVCIGIGASVKRRNVITEDFLYYSKKGDLLGYHSKIALPKQDSILTNGASELTPEADYERASGVIEIPELGVRVGTVFCWQVFFVDFWARLMEQRCSLVVHPIKFAPRAWYKKDRNLEGKETRIGFSQNSGSDLPEDDSLGWIRKLKYESEFKQLPIAVSCNTWNGGAKYLALAGWVDEVTGKTNLAHLPSTAETERVIVTTYDPALYDSLPNWNQSMYRDFKEVFEVVAAKTMMRKAIRAEKKARSGATAGQLNKKLAGDAVGKGRTTSKQPVLVAGLSSLFDDF
jgi:hypothetical protein